jgi:hypothetical protein
MIVYNKRMLIGRGLRADGAGLIPSDLDAERALMGCLMVDTHGCDSTSRLPQARFPLRTLRDRERAAGHRPTRPVGQTASSNWTTCPVLTDRTDTWNLEGQGCPVAGDDGSIVFDTDQPAEREIRSANDPGAPGKHEARNPKQDRSKRSFCSRATIGCGVALPDGSGSDPKCPRFGHGDFGRPNRHTPFRHLSLPHFPFSHFAFPPCRITQMSVT